MKFNFKAFVGVRFSEALSRAEWLDVYHEIENLSNYYKLIFNNEIIVDRINFSFCKTLDDYTLDSEKFKTSNIDEVLKIEFQINGRFLTRKNISSVYFFEKQLVDLVIAISIAKKGAIEIGSRSIIFLNNKKVATSSLVLHSISFCIEEAKEIKWPSFQIISLQRTLDWLSYYRNQIDVISTDSFGRALNAYSYLFTTETIETSVGGIFWAVMGLEAIYGEGNSNLQHQINLKSQILLGSRTEHKKIFNEIYSFRSKFIHGDLNFQNKFCIVNYMDNDIADEFIESDLVNKYLATAILVATFQQLIVKNLYKIDFDYVIKPDIL